MPIFTISNKRVLFIHIPKTGGTTIERHLKRLGRVDLLNGNRKQFKELPCSPQHFHISVLNSLFNLNEFDYIFAVVRCPFARIKSEFQMRIRGKQKKSSVTKPDINPWLTNTLAQYGKNKFIYDNHIRPQIEFLYDMENNFLSTKIDVFNFDIGIPVILEKVFSILDIKFQYSENLRGQTFQKFDTVDLSSESCNKIKNFYNKDLELLDTLDALGRTYLPAGEPTKAIEACQSVVYFKEDNPSVQKTLGDLLQKEGQINKAINAYEKALELNPKSAEWYNTLGDAYLKANNPAEAIAAYEKALALNPDLPPNIRKKLGDAFNKSGQVQEAIALYKQAIKLNPNNAGFYNVLGDAYLKANNPAEAIATYEKALELNPNLPPNIRKKLGDAFLQIGQPETAIEFYQKAIELKPNNTNFKNALEDAMSKLTKT